MQVTGWILGSNLKIALCTLKATLYRLLFKLTLETTSNTFSFGIAQRHTTLTVAIVEAITKANIFSLKALKTSLNQTLIHLKTCRHLIFRRENDDNIKVKLTVANPQPRPCILTSHVTNFLYYHINGHC